MATFKKSAPSPMGKSNTASTTTAKNSASGDEFAEAFNSAASDPQSVKSFKELPIGRWEALCFKAGWMDKGVKAVAWLDYEITQEEGGHAGERGRAFFNLIDEIGIVQQGVQYLARDLTNMGFVDAQHPIKNLDDLKDNVLPLVEDNPCWVVIHVKINKGYANIFLSEVMENQEAKPGIDSIP